MFRAQECSLNRDDDHVRSHPWTYEAGPSNSRYKQYSSKSNIGAPFRQNIACKSIKKCFLARASHIKQQKQNHCASDRPWQRSFLLIFPVRLSIRPSVRPSVSDHVDCKRACHAWFLHQWTRLRRVLTLTSLLLPQSLDYLAIT